MPIKIRCGLYVLKENRMYFFLKLPTVHWRNYCENDDKKSHVINLPIQMMFPQLRF